MAKAEKEKVNKTAAVKEYLAGHGDCTTAQVVDQLGHAGIEVSANYVSNIRSRMNREEKAATKAPKRNTKATTAAASAPTGNNDAFAIGVALIHAAGGFSAAHKVIDRLAMLTTFPE